MASSALLGGADVLLVEDDPGLHTIPVVLLTTSHTMRGRPSAIRTR